MTPTSVGARAAESRDASRGRTAAVALALLTDGPIVAYGLWTIVSTLTSITGASTRTGLTPGVLGCMVLSAVLGLIVWRKPDWIAAYVRSAEELPAAAPLAIDPRVRIALLLGIPFAIAVWMATRSLVALWAVALVGYWIATAIGLTQRAELPGMPAPSATDAVTEQRRIRILHLLALACAVFTLLAIRPRTDDPFYLSMSVSVADFPDQALLATRTLHGPESDTQGSQPMFAPYKIHSFETLAGYIAYLTGLDVSVIVHFGIATLFGWLTPFALARLMRWLLPSNWLLATAATLAYLVIDGSAGRGYANQAFVRMFNGKAAMLSFAIPLILYYGLRLGARVTGPRFALLALAQIGAMGMSSTGIWLAPIVAVLATAAGTPRARELPKTVALGSLSAGYVLAMGAWIFSQLPADRGVILTSGAPAPAGSTTEIAAASLGFVLPDVLGPEHTAIALLTMFTLAWALARGVEAFRLLAYLGVALLTVLVNPWLISVVGRLITGSITYERVFWVLPVPVAIGLAIAQLMGWLSARFSARASLGLTCALFVAFCAVSVERTVIGESNRAWLQFPPSLKVWPMARTMAERLCKVAPRGTVILASEAVSQQLVTIGGCGHPVIADARWLVAPIEEKERRIALQRYVSVHDDLPAERVAQFHADLDRYRVKVVGLTAEGLRNRTVKAQLRAHGFKKLAVVATQHIWVRRFKTRRER
jgi:hypothetical protein